jgi:hypothetical protein
MVVVQHKLPQSSGRDAAGRLLPEIEPKGPANDVHDSEHCETNRNRHVT